MLNTGLCFSTSGEGQGIPVEDERAWDGDVIELGSVLSVVGSHRRELCVRRAAQSMRCVVTSVSGGEGTLHDKKSAKTNKISGS